MEVIPSPRAGGSGSMPFQRHNVEEWSRLDRLTGMLEHARVETGHWAANTSNTSHKYGKVVDSRARNLADGSVQQRQRKQLEVFQAQVPGGSLQVIRTQSVTSTSSSSSSWRGPPATAASTDFENLQLALNPLDLSSQKTKASVGRSGSIGSRRPPSRPRSLISKVDSAISEEETHKQNVGRCLTDVSKLCHQIHEEAKKNLSNSLPSSSSFLTSPTLNNDTVNTLDDANRKDCSDNDYGCIKSRKWDSFETSRTGNIQEIVSNGLVHPTITRKKSCSSEDLQNNDINEEKKSSEENEMLADWKRTSKVRRSLQFPSKGNHLDIIPNGNVSKLRKELEDGKKLDPMKTNTSSFDTLENIFRYGTEARNTSNMYSTNSLTEKSGNDYEIEGFSRRVESNKPSPNKRHSFVTVESLKEVRGRLRRLSSPPLDGIELPNYSKNKVKNVEDSDDGIVTEDSNKATTEMDRGSTEEAPTSRVKSYVYGMEAMANSNSNVRKSTAGTGSLESRTSNRSSSSGGSRSEEWYNRRKSYGFEQVHSQQNNNHPDSMAFKEKRRVESSTDSGICRSSETVTPSWTQLSFMCNRAKENDQLTHGNIKVNHSIQIKEIERETPETESRGNESNFQKGRRTVVTLGSDHENNRSGGAAKDNPPNSWRFDSQAATNMTAIKNARRLSEPVTVTIPVVSEDSFNSTDGSDTIEARRLYFRQLSEGTSLSIENGWKKSPTIINGCESPQKNLSDETKSLAARRELLLKHSSVQEAASCWSRPTKKTDNEVKRHSIAVDESKYVRDGIKSYNFHDKRTGHFNFENGFLEVSKSIPDFEKNSGISPSGKEETGHFNKELEYKSASLGACQDSADIRSIINNFEEEDGDEMSINHHLAGKKHKKVEFCKTEVHFAAEPGRFNIVETDEKPPPNNMFRRRRRNSSTSIPSTQSQDANKTSLPEIRFGDSLYEKKLLGGTEPNNQTFQIAVSLDNCPKTKIDTPETIIPITISPTDFEDDADKEDNIFTQANATILSPVRQEPADIDVHTSEENSNDSLFSQLSSMTPGSPNNAMPRSILKNNRKPRPFHLGEMEDDLMLPNASDKSERSSGDPETKWGIRLKPIQNRESPASMWRSTVTLQNKTFEDQLQHNYSPTLQEDKLNSSPQNFGEGTELKNLLKSLRPAFQKKSVSDSFSSSLGSKSQSPDPVIGGMEVKISSTLPVQQPTWSVAERVRQVEDLKHASMETRGYSTRVNFGAGEATVIESGSSDDQQSIGQKQSSLGPPLYQPNNRPKPIWLRREERKQETVQQCDTKRQTASDKGLVVRISKSDGNINIDSHSPLDFNAKSEEHSRSDDPNSNSTKKTTTILIDLSPSPSDNCISNVELLQRPMHKNSVGERTNKSTGTLRSPSLIMKTISKSTQVQESNTDETQQSMQNAQKNKRVVNRGVDRQTDKQDTPPVAAPRTKKLAANLEKRINTRGSNACVRNTERTINTKTFVKKNCVKPQAEERSEGKKVVASQLAALKQLYYNNAELSDDSERADEEVRSYMSGGGDEDDKDQDEDASSVVSGSWSRMRAFRNIQHHFHKFNQAQPHKDYSEAPPLMKLQSSRSPAYQQSVTTAQLQSYNNDSGRLRAVETLVSTRSGHPKITSISLRYDGDHDTEQSSQDSSASYQSSFHSLPSSKKGSLHITEPISSSVYPNSLGSSPATTAATPAKSYNKPLISQQRASSSTSKSVMTQKQRELTPAFGDSSSRVLGQASQNNSEESNYENINPKSSVRRDSDSFGGEPLALSSMGRKEFHHEDEDKNRTYNIKREKHSELESMNSSSRKTSNRRSLSPVAGKSIYREQGKKPSTSSVSTQQQRTFRLSNSSDHLSTRKSTGLDMQKRRVPKEEEVKKDSHFQVKALSNGKHKHLEGTFIRSSIEKHTESDELSITDETEKRVGKLKISSHDRSVSPQIDDKMTTSPLYENVKMLSLDSITKSNGHDHVETESAILEELTRAADQILQAVNGYTDEESYRASSDDDDNDSIRDCRRRRGKRCGQARKPSANLGTISESPSSKKQQETESHSHKNNASTRKNQRLTKTRLGPTSSTSSVESFTREVSRSTAQARSLQKQEGSSSIEDHSKSKIASSSTSSSAVKSGSRAARLLQRASSRELLLQTYASSSEDVGSGVEGGSTRKPTAPRRTRVHNSNSNKTDAAKTNSRKTTVSSDSQQSPSTKQRPRKRDSDVTKPKERYPGSTNKMVPLTRKSSGGDSGDRLTVSRVRSSRTRDDEGHPRGSSRPATRRENTDLRHRTQGGGTTIDPISRDKSERTAVYERRVMMGNISRSPASCVVYVPAKQHCPCICS
ncbi:platelet binding protein GspB-like isoform X2 [Periplaneta americana]|uniref:platelet binding protein GspB-like isoform X2 n=1 Tax=Periplaneta americana TaxID=6978 RepID=UPI0037E75C6E